MACEHYANWYTNFISATGDKRSAAVLAVVKNHKNYGVFVY